MKTITSAKENMALLSQEQLAQAAFGTLCQAFALRLLERAGYEDGLYQQVALEFLEEGRESPPPVKNVFNIDLSIVLESLRREEQETRREKRAAKKLLTQALRLQEQTAARSPGKQAGTVQRFLTVQLYPTTIWRQTVYAETLLRGGSAQEGAVPGHLPPMQSGRPAARRATRLAAGRGTGQTKTPLPAADVQLPVQAILAWRRSQRQGANPAVEERRTGQPPQGMGTVQASTGQLPETLTYRTEQEGAAQTAPSADRQAAQAIDQAVNRALQRSRPEDWRSSRPTGEAAQASTGQPPETLTYRTEQEGAAQTAPSADRQAAQTVDRTVNRALQRSHPEDWRSSRPTGEAAPAPGQASGRTAARSDSPEQQKNLPAPAQVSGERQEQRKNQLPQAQQDGQPRRSRREQQAAASEGMPSALWQIAATDKTGTADCQTLRAATPSQEGRAEGATPEPPDGDTTERNPAFTDRDGQRFPPQRGSLGTVSVQPYRPGEQLPAAWLPLEPLELAQWEGGTARRASRESQALSPREEQTGGPGANPEPAGAGEGLDSRRAQERTAAPEQSTLRLAGQGIATVSRDVRMAGGGSLRNVQKKAEAQPAAGDAQRSQPSQPPTTALQHPQTAQPASGAVQLQQPGQRQMPELHYPQAAQPAAGDAQQSQPSQPPTVALQHPQTAQPASGDVQRRQSAQAQAAEPHRLQTAQSVVGTGQHHLAGQPFTGVLHHPQAAQPHDPVPVSGEANTSEYIRIQRYSEDYKYPPDPIQSESELDPSIPLPSSFSGGAQEGQRRDGRMDSANAKEYFEQRLDLSHQEGRREEHAEAVRSMAAQPASGEGRQQTPQTPPAELHHLQPGQPVADGNAPQSAAGRLDSRGGLPYVNRWSPVGAARQPLTAGRTPGVSEFSAITSAGAGGVNPVAGQAIGTVGFTAMTLLSHREGRSLTNDTLADVQSGGDTPSVPTGGRRETPLSRQMSGAERQAAGEGAWPEQIELSYLPRQQTEAPPQSPLPQASGAMDSDYVRSLPAWAQRFLKEGGAEAAGSAPQMGVARPIAALSGGTAQQEQVTWTAPQATRRPAEITYKQSEGPQATTAQPGRMSDSELRRTADRVYQMIEERIRRERRRLGL